MAVGAGWSGVKTQLLLVLRDQPEKLVFGPSSELDDAPKDTTTNLRVMGWDNHRLTGVRQNTFIGLVCSALLPKLEALAHEDLDNQARR